MANAVSSGVVYVRLSDSEKELLESVRKAMGVSQNAYARMVLLEALSEDSRRYADVIEKQRELARHGE